MLKLPLNSFSVSIYPSLFQGHSQRWPAMLTVGLTFCPFFNSIWSWKKNIQAERMDFFLFGNPEGISWTTFSWYRSRLWKCIHMCLLIYTFIYVYYKIVPSFQTQKIVSGRYASWARGGTQIVLQTSTTVCSLIYRKDKAHHRPQATLAYPAPVCGLFLWQTTTKWSLA